MDSLVQQYLESLLGSQQQQTQGGSSYPISSYSRPQQIPKRSRDNSGLFRAVAATPAAPPQPRLQPQQAIPFGFYPSSASRAQRSRPAVPQYGAFPFGRGYAYAPQGYYNGYDDEDYEDVYGQDDSRDAYLKQLLGKIQQQQQQKPGVSEEENDDEDYDLGGGSVANDDSSDDSYVQGRYYDPDNAYKEESSNDASQYRRLADLLNYPPQTFSQPNRQQPAFVYPQKVAQPVQSPQISRSDYDDLLRSLLSKAIEKHQPVHESPTEQQENEEFAGVDTGVPEPVAQSVESPTSLEPGITEDQDEDGAEAEDEAGADAVPESSSATPSKVRSSIKKPKLRRRSTASLNVHAGKPDDEPTKSSKKSEPLKVSAPQLNTNLPFSPPVNVYDFPSNYVIAVSLPGVTKEFVDINFHPSTSELVVKGEVKNQYLADDDNYVDLSKVLKISEQRFGSFERVIKLPFYPPIQDEDIKAKFVNGILEIKVAKVQGDELKTKQVKKIELEEIPDEELERESSNQYI